MKKSLNGEAFLVRPERTSAVARLVQESSYEAIRTGYETMVACASPTPE